MRTFELKRRSTIDRVRYICEQYKARFANESGGLFAIADIEKILAVVEAVSKLGLECDYEDVLLGYSACGNCKVCVVNARMAEL